MRHLRFATLSGTFDRRRNNIFLQEFVEGITFAHTFQDPLYNQGPTDRIKSGPGTALFHDAILFGTPDPIRISVSSLVRSKLR